MTTMNSVLRTTAWLILPVCLFASSAVAANGRTDLEARIRDLERRIAALESKSLQTSWITVERASEIRGLVAEILADADNRTLLRNQDMSSGWSGHPFIASDDGDFLLELSGRMQFRYATSIQDDGPGNDTTRGGFEFRRNRLIFSGHMIDPSIEYKVQAEFERSGGLHTLQDAWIRKIFDNGLYLMVGQVRPGFLRESNTSSGAQLGVERSLIHSAFGVDRTQGVDIGREGERFRARLMIHDGDDLQNTPALAADTEFAVGGQAQFLIAGQWKQFDDFTSWPDESFGAMIGGGVHYQKDEFGTPAGPEVEDARFTIDGSLEFGSVNLFAAFVYRSLDADGLDDLDQFGVVVHGGFFVTDNCEIFARYQWGDDDLPGGDLSIVEIGFNRYFAGHDLKWTTDIGYAFESVKDTFASSGAAWREDPADDNGQIVVRTQFQLQF